MFYYNDYFWIYNGIFNGDFIMSYLKMYSALVVKSPKRLADISILAVEDKIVISNVTRWQRFKFRFLLWWYNRVLRRTDMLCEDEDE